MYLFNIPNLSKDFSGISSHRIFSNLYEEQKIIFRNQHFSALESSSARLKKQ